MAKNCILTLIIKLLGGQEQRIEVPAPSNVTSVRELVNFLRTTEDPQNDKLTLLDRVAELTNESGFPTVELDPLNITGDMIGNFNLERLYNSLNQRKDLYTTRLYERVKELGYNTEDLSIFITLKPSEFSGTYVSKDGRIITIMLHNLGNLLNFLKYLIVKKSYEITGVKKDKEEANSELTEFTIYLNILDAFEDLYKAVLEKGATTKMYEKHPRLLNLTLNRLIDLYFNDYRTFSFLRTFPLYDAINAALGKIFSVVLLDINSLKDLLVKDFLTTLESLDKTYKDRILTKKLIELADKYLIPYNNVLDIIYYINSHIQTEYNIYFDVKFIANFLMSTDKLPLEYIVFKKLPNKPVFTPVSINSRFFGDIITPLGYRKGYNIFTVNGRYYVSKKIPITDDMSTFTHNFSSIKGAYDFIEKVDGSCTFDKRGIEYVGNLMEDPIKAPDEFKFLRYDHPDIRKAISLTMLNSNVELTVGKKLSIIKRNLANLDIRTFWKNNKELRDEFISKLGQISTTYLLELLIYLKNYYDITTSTLRNCDNLMKAIDFLLSQTPSVYTASKVERSDKTTYYSISKSDSSPIDLMQTRPRLLNQDIIAIAENLGQRFGVKVHPMTTKEIRAQIKGVNPYSSAFILNGEIYVNMDKAYSTNLIHEFGHLIFGTIKLANPALYYKFVDFIDSLRGMDQFLKFFLKYESSQRARSDINEEVLADIFGKLMSSKFKSGLNITETDVDKIKQEYIKGINRVFDPNKSLSLTKDINILLNLTFQEFEDLFGCAFTALGLLNEDIEVDMLNLSFTSRKVSNTIERLIREGVINENCD